MQASNGSAPLPQELLEYVVDYLSDDHEALKACSLVSRSLVSASQRNLFRHLFISLSGSGLDIDSFLTSLCSRTQLHLSFVQLLTIQSLNSLCDYNRELLLRAIRSLVNLTHLDIRCLPDQRFDIAGFTSGISSTDILRECFRYNITRISLYGCSSFPSEVLHQCKSLARLALRSVAFMPMSKSLPFSERIPLKSLYLGQLWVRPPPESIISPKFFEHNSCAWDISQLKALGCCAQKMKDYQMFLEFTENFSLLHVTSLAIEVPPELTTARDHQLIDLSLLPHLTSLTLSIEENASARQSYIPWMISQLNETPFLNQLCEIYIRITLSSFATMITIREQDWRLLDECLAKDKFSKLRLVSFKVYLQYWSSSARVDNEEVREAFRDVLPKTMERKALDIDVSATRWALLNEKFPTLSC